MNNQHHHKKGGKKSDTPAESEVSKESLKTESAHQAKTAASVKSESAKESPSKSAKSESAPKAKIAESANGEIGESNATESAESPEILALRKALEEANQNVAQLKDSFLRAKAESENTHRRAQEEITKARKFALEAFAKDLLAPWDSLDAALNAKNQSLESLKEGLMLIKKQLDSAFQKNALLEINPKEQKFDPHQHQAVGLVPSALPKDTVAKVLQKGFLISDRVLRPAMVMVSNGENVENPPS